VSRHVWDVPALSGGVMVRFICERICHGRYRVCDLYDDDESSDTDTRMQQELDAVTCGSPISACECAVAETEAAR
jgi:hypothetical protein